MIWINGRVKYFSLNPVRTGPAAYGKYLLFSRDGDIYSVHREVPTGSGLRGAHLKMNWRYLYTRFPGEMTQDVGQGMINGQVGDYIR